MEKKFDRSPGDIKDKSEIFFKNVELNFDHMAEKKFVIAFLGDFNL